MATAGIKFDDGTGAYVSNCFPVRSVIRYGEPGEGAWLEAHRAEQRRRFKAVVCANPPRTYSRLKHERIVAERQDEEFPEPLEPPTPGLDGFFLLKHGCVDDPSDLCSVNIAARNITHCQPDDFQLFDNVAYINAADNSLPLEIFDKFPILRELEIPVNGISSLSLSHTMFRQLEMLDLSYNSLTGEALLDVGYLRNLKVLYFSGNGLVSLPENLAGFYITQSGKKKRRFPKLEILCLDDNKLDNYTAFAPLAGIKGLKHLNLENNEISSVPQLEPKTIRHDNLNQQSGAEEQEEEAAGTADEAEEEEDEDAEYKELTQTNPNVEFAFVSLEVSAEPNEEAELAQEEANQTADVCSESEDELDDEEGPAIPFPQLRFLSLAHNYITEEEDLLPLAAWPNLTQVHIYDNPLSNNRTGDPPLLKKFLTERLGIELIRKEPEVPKPPRDFPPARKNRRVDSHIPPVPKCDVDKLLQLEAANRNALPSSAKSQELPPVLKSNPATTLEQGEESPQKENKDPEKPADSERAEAERGHMTPEELAGEADKGETFFMTQVEDKGGEFSTFGKPPPGYPTDQTPYTAYEDDRRVSTTPRRIVKLDPAQQKMFEGYEELLVEDDIEKTIKIPTDVHASVKALQYALKHPVVNNNMLRLDTNQKPFLPYKRSDTRGHVRPVTKAEKISRAMESVKRMNTVIEAPLERALTDKELQRKYPDAARLLKDIQRKYAKARANSTADAKSVAHMVKNSLTQRPHTERIYQVDKDTSMTQAGGQQ